MCLFSFVPLTKCDLTLVDIRSLDQAVPSTTPELHTVNREYLFNRLL
jgi:hypothetical protein